MLSELGRPKVVRIRVFCLSVFQFRRLKSTSSYLHYLHTLTKRTRLLFLLPTKAPRDHSSLQVVYKDLIPNDDPKTQWSKEIALSLPTPRGSSRDVHLLKQHTSTVSGTVARVLGRLEKAKFNFSLSHKANLQIIDFYY